MMVKLTDKEKAAIRTFVGGIKNKVIPMIDSKRLIESLEKEVAYFEDILENGFIEKDVK